MEIFMNNNKCDVANKRDGKNLWTVKYTYLVDILKKIASLRLKP